MEHIFWAEKRKNGFFFSKEELKHMSVVRVVFPNQILFTCGDGILHRGIANKDGSVEDAEIVESSDKTGIDILFGVCDKSRISYILEKCTELGADSFTPLITAKSEKYSLSESKAERIIVSALKQSRRFTMPEYRTPIKLKDIAADGSTQLIFGSIKENRRKINLTKSRISLLIGPPLGFTEEEENFLIEKEAEPFHFDTGILRTETFAHSLLSIVHYLKAVKNG
ncbi:MAG: RsmE family RNA methyltransferase [bacterium]